MKAAAASPRFRTTHWNLVIAAGDLGTSGADQALETLCRTYWYPIYLFLRHSGYPSPDAQDMTQNFFAHVMEREALRTVHPSKGRFRSWLLASLKHLLSNERDRALAFKRGGNIQFISIEGMESPSWGDLEAGTQSTPDELYDRGWALLLLEGVLLRLRQDYESEDKGPLFEELHGCLTGEDRGAGYAAVAQRLGVTEGAVKMAVLRLRRRFGDLLRQAVEKTVLNHEDVDEEIRYLFSAVNH